MKAAAPLVLGGRSLPRALERAANLLPAALLAALVVTSSVADGRSLTVDARLVGVIAAALALWRRMPFVVVILIAAVTTGLARMLTG